MNQSKNYLTSLSTLIDDIVSHELPAIEQAGSLIAERLASGGLLHAFGTGHSGLLASELFYRAGGICAVNPIFDDELMLHVSASASTRAERDGTRAERLFIESGLGAGDALLAISNSGGNGAVIGVAERARHAGALVIALVSRRHQQAEGPQHPEQSLVDLAHVVIDNHGEVGDAIIDVGNEGARMGPTSTVAGAAIVNAIAIETVASARQRGLELDVFTSANVSGGDAVNDALIAKYTGRVKAL